MRMLSRPRSVLEAIRAGVSGSLTWRHFRNTRRFPGVYLHPTANCAIDGKFDYGSDVTFGEGCNLIVPDGAVLRVGSRCYIGRYVEIGPGGEIDIGGQTSIQDRSIIIGDVSLGRYCVVSLNVLMTSGTHYFEKWAPIHIRDQDLMVANDPELRQQHSRKISIGEDCWIGMNSVVMPGISVGRGCVIGANSVVTGNLDPYVIVGGAPARVIGSRFKFVPPSRIDWRDSEHLPYFYSGFELAAAEREANLPFEGHVAADRFALWLAGGSLELRLRAKAASRQDAVIESGHIQEKLNPEWGEYRFAVSDSEGPTWFQVKGGPVAVSEAWVI
jgi:acetyltransferase-like isoleucine patch superfamily enzyme